MEWSTNVTSNGTNATGNFTYAPTIGPTHSPSFYPSFAPTPQPSYQPTAKVIDSSTEYSNQYGEKFGTFMVLIILSIILGMLAIASVRKLQNDSNQPIPLDTGHLTPLKRRAGGRASSLYALSSKLKESNRKFSALPSNDAECPHGV